jgi:flap endonuclease-1
MDTLTFNAPILFRHLTFSEAKKQPISEINLKAALAGLDMTMSQVRLPRDLTPHYLT